MNGWMCGVCFSVFFIEFVHSLRSEYERQKKTYCDKKDTNMDDNSNDEDDDDMIFPLSRLQALVYMYICVYSCVYVYSLLTCSFALRYCCWFRLIFGFRAKTNQLQKFRYLSYQRFISIK